MSKNYLELLKDPRWQKKRLFILQRDDWQCQYCQDRETTLHVHHIRYFLGDPWECPDDYLVTLCENCHQYEEHIKGVDLYAMVQDCRLPCMHVETLLEHLRYHVKMRLSEGSRLFDILHGINEFLVPHEKLFEYVQWRRENPIQ